jgi:translocation and assembly module TamA
VKRPTRPNAPHLLANRFAATCLIVPLCFALAGPAHAAPVLSIKGVQDVALRALIEEASAAPGPAPRTAAEGRRQGNAAAKAAIALLRSEGYYDAVAEPQLAPGSAIQVVLHITLGSRYKISHVTIDWVGPAPQETAREGAIAALGLAPTAPGRAADVIGAEGRALARLHKLGYADADLRPRQVVVDHTDQSVTPTLRIAAGPLIRLGEVRKVGNGPTHIHWLASLAPWKSGDYYDPALLAKLEKRLLDTGAYESATVALRPAPAGVATSGIDQRTVDVTLVERKRYSLELGAGYSTTEGSGVDAKWTRYNRLGVGDSLILTTKAYDIQQKLDLELVLPDWKRADQLLKIGGGFLGDRTSAYDDLGGGVRLDVIRKYDLTSSFTLGSAFDFASTREKTAVNLSATPVGQTLNLLITTGLAAFVLDRSDSILNPNRGWRLSAETDPTWITGDRNLEYVKTETQLSGYLPIGGLGTVLAARIRLGSILGGSIPNVPADRRFYGGGGGSVRGYGYQAVGPRLGDNTPAGGLSLTEGSIEIRQKLTSRWALVAFADAGDVGKTASPHFNSLALGVGAGIRYDLGFAPIRLDIATPVNPRSGDSPVQIYISIGQAF